VALLASLSQRQPRLAHMFVFVDFTAVLKEKSVYLKARDILQSKGHPGMGTDNAPSPDKSDSSSNTRRPPPKVSSAAAPPPRSVGSEGANCGKAEG